jgi:hypothetical protein
MTDPARYLNAPIGVPGSGRVRYGAAMELWRAGRISAEVLEVYRVTSAHDGRDPMAVLRAAGLPLPELEMKDDVLTRLYHAARDYLLALNHPGSAEVRLGLPADPGPARIMPYRPNALVDQWLQPALDLVAPEHPGLAAAIAAAKEHLEWITYNAYPLDLIGEDFARGHAYASIVGEDAPFPARDYDMGLLLILPHVMYRDRAHPAPELYAPLTGPHGWRFGVERPLIIKPAHMPVWNPPNFPHLTKVGKVPLLTLYAWTKDVNELAVVLPATDWEALEAAEID